MRLDEPVWMDRDGNTCTEEEAFGCKVHHKIVRHDLCFCGDEVRDNISMKRDGYNGGEKVLTETGTIGQRKTSTRSRNFTKKGTCSGPMARECKYYKRNSCRYATDS